MAIGKLEKVDLRELWKHEERGFSVWLADNLDRLSDALGFTLSEPQREVKVGTFEVDLVAEDEQSNAVIIENQLEQTDHDHLGKLLTYLTNLEAKAAVWITRHPRAEHVRVISWLNEVTPEDIAFFLVKLEAFRIGDSPPAPHFSVIAGPSPEAKAFGQQKKEYAERHLQRFKFWESLLERAAKSGLTLHAGRSPSKDHWLSAGAGRAGMSLTYLIWMKESGGELFIATGDVPTNKRIFDSLQANQAAIDKTFGPGLNWERLDEKKGCRLQCVIPGAGLSSGEDEWPKIQERMIDAMHGFRRQSSPTLPPPRPPN